MAVTLCKKNIAKSIVPVCDTPLIKGYEAVGIIVNKEDFDEWTKVKSATNPRIYSSLLHTDNSVFAIQNPKAAPFEGSTTEYNNDSIYGGKFNKSIVVDIPLRGAETAMSIIDPMFAGGKFVLILEKKDHRGDGSFEIIGSENGAVLTAGSRDESANGFWQVTLTEANANYAEVVFFDTDYATTKRLFDILITNAG